MDISQELHPVCIVVNDRDGFFAVTRKWANIRSMHLQLCQPGAGNTAQRCFLPIRGEGVYHLGS